MDYECGPARIHMKSIFFFIVLHIDARYGLFLCHPFEFCSVLASLNTAWSRGDFGGLRVLSPFDFERPVNNSLLDFTERA